MLIPIIQAREEPADKCYNSHIYKGRGSFRSAQSGRRKRNDKTRIRHLSYQKRHYVVNVTPINAPSLLLTVESDQGQLAQPMAPAIFYSTLVL